MTKNKENKIACLGPEGSYSNEALIKFDKKAMPVFYNSIWKVIDAVANDEVKRAVVPIENSLHGTVFEALDSLYYKNLKINDEVILPINHSICGLNKKTKKKDIKFIYSHNQALNQCKNFINKNYPKVTLISTESTSSAVLKIKSENITNALAIGSKFAAHKYGMEVIAKNIQDRKNNKTLFAIVSKKPNSFSLPFVILVINPKKDRPGLLHDILGVFKKDAINLLNIESRPSRENLGKYIFYIKYHQY